MATYTPISYGPVTSEKLARALQLLKEFGVPLVDEGAGQFSCSFKGFAATAFFDQARERLTLTLLDKPWRIPFWAIKMKVAEKMREEGIYELD